MAKKSSRVDPNALVVKSNSLIQSLRYDLTATEQKLILLAISRLDSMAPPDSPLPVLEFNASEVCAALGMETGNRFAYLRKALKGLLSAVLTYWEEEGSDAATWTATHWVQKAKLTPKTMILHLEFDPGLRPYLQDIHSRFTKYHLREVLGLSGKYAVRLYEILMSYKGMAGKSESWIIPTMELETLRSLFDIGPKEYRLNADFLRWVIRPAIEEINKVTEVIATWKIIKSGRRASGVVFTVCMGNTRPALTQDELDIAPLEDMLRGADESERRRFEEMFATERARNLGIIPDEWVRARALRDWAKLPLPANMRKRGR